MSDLPGRKLARALIAVSALSLSGCTLGIASAIAGGSAGLAVATLGGSGERSTVRSALRDAAVGGNAGRAITAQMDLQATELAAVADVPLERVDEGLLVTLDPGLIFAHDSDAILNSARPLLDRVAASVRRHPNTELLIVVHTDSVGSERFNQGLSELRAQSTAQYFAEQGISLSRIESAGVGESEPVADNETEQGRALNRRIEIAIMASDASLGRVVADDRTVNRARMR